MGYFSFAYKGYDPHISLLTRNTFDPLATLLMRLGIAQNRIHTSKPEKGLANLLDTLDSGVPAILWADMFSLPYNALPYDERNWAMLPILVYGYDEKRDTVWIADRARVPLSVTTAELAAARARVKKDKFRVLTLDPPIQEKLTAAVQAGILDCIKLYTEAPPKGSKSNFGLAAFQWWADLLTKPQTRLSWEKVFPAGGKMVAGLKSAFYHINIFGKDEYAERDVFANFLDETSLILDKPTLRQVAQHFRVSAEAWQTLSNVLLPDGIPQFKETRERMLRRHKRFLEAGNDSLDEIWEIDAQLDAIKTEMDTNFPLNPNEVVTFRENLRNHILEIHDIEKEAIMALQDAMI